MAATIEDIVPFPSSPSALIDSTFAFLSWPTIALTISSPCEFVPDKLSSIKDTLLITFWVSSAPVSINAITFSFFSDITGVEISSSSVVIGFVESLTSKLVISTSVTVSLTFSSSAAAITISGSTA